MTPTSAGKLAAMVSTTPRGRAELAATMAKAGFCRVADVVTPITGRRIPAFELAKPAPSAEPDSRKNGWLA